MTELVATFDMSTRWLSGRGGRCYVAVANGGIYDVRSPTAPIYHHDHEPYRVAISPNEALVASTDWGGGVKVWNAMTKRVVADLRQLHNGLVVNVIWLSDSRLLTAGYDGFVHILDERFSIVHSWNLGAPVRYLAAQGQSINAALSDGTLWTLSLRDGATRSLSLDATFTALALSPNGEFVAVGTDGGELLVIDRASRISAYHFQASPVRAVTFETDQTIIACASENRLMRITHNGQLQKE